MKVFRPEVFHLMLLIASLTRGFLLRPHYSIVRPARSASPVVDKHFMSTTGRLVAMKAASAVTSATIPSWSDLVSRVGETEVGKALDAEVLARKGGGGSAHVQNTLRKFDSTTDGEPQITLFRDHAGWCPYCQKTMLLVEEKRVPIRISLVPMRSYGDKPREFLRKVPNGLLPAIEVNGQVITESQVIMELLDQWHSPSDGYRPMLPAKDDVVGRERYSRLARLERDLFSWWCTLVFRPEGPRLGGNNPLGRLLGGEDESMSGSMEGFLDCLRTVDRSLKETEGPWFFGEYDYPTMIDFVYVSHVERMLASCAYWKGLNLRDPKWKLDGINEWLDAFEKREPYLAFKSDYYTHVMDIPPQYGPGYDGGFERDRDRFSKMIAGRDGSWNLPLPHDDSLQPLYRGPPLPLCVLAAANIEADKEGSYESCDRKAMEMACRFMAAWKLAGNGANVANFAARGGPKGAKNPRKSFGGPLADPYAAPDADVQPAVDAALRVVCSALLDDSQEEGSHLPSDALAGSLRAAVAEQQAPADGVASSLAYLRDRVGVPRDLPLAAARYLRAYLNWGIDALNQ